MRMTNVERASRPVHRSVGPGDPTYGARKRVTDRSGLETRPTGRERVSQIGRAWRPDLRGKKRCQDSFWGLPRGRRVDWRLRRRAIACTQFSSPKGEPRLKLLPTALSSAAVSGLLTCSVQRGERAIGQAESRRGSRSGSSSSRLREPHLQSSARLTSPASKAFRSTCRQTNKK
jgi:hypothetical protein